MPKDKGAKFKKIKLCDVKHEIIHRMKKLQSCVLQFLNMQIDFIEQFVIGADILIWKYIKYGKGIVCAEAVGWQKPSSLGSGI